MTETLPEERHALLFDRSIGAVKEAVPLSRYCADHGIELRRSGAQLLAARCPLPDHEDKTPSWTVFGDEKYWCFGCHRGGDVVDLHMVLDGHPEAWSAMVDLSMRYGVEMPQRPDRWHRAQDRKAEYRRLVAAEVGDVLKRRLFGLCVVPVLEVLYPGEALRAEYEAELEAAWERFQARAFWPAFGERFLERRGGAET